MGREQHYQGIGMRVGKYERKQVTLQCNGKIFIYCYLFKKDLFGFFFNYYFFREREHKWEGQKETEREYQAVSLLSAEPDTGLNLTTMIWATTKSPVLNQLHCTGPPKYWSWLEVECYTTICLVKTHGNVYLHKEILLYVNQA